MRKDEYFIEAFSPNGDRVVFQTESDSDTHPFRMAMIDHAGSIFRCFAINKFVAKNIKTDLRKMRVNIGTIYYDVYSNMLHREDIVADIVKVYDLSSPGCIISHELSSPPNTFVFARNNEFIEAELPPNIVGRDKNVFVVGILSIIGASKYSEGILLRPEKEEHCKVLIESFMPVYSVYLSPGILTNEIAAKILSLYEPYVHGPSSISAMNVQKINLTL